MARELRFWVLVLFGASVIISTGPTYTIPLPPLPGAMAWKQVVLADLLFVALLAMCALPFAPALSLGRRDVWLPAGVLFGAIALTVVVSPRPGAGIPDLGRFGYSLLLFGLVACMRLSPTHLRRFAVVYCLAAFVVAALAMSAWVLFRWRGIPSPWLQINTEPGWSLGLSARALASISTPPPATNG
jgi:hypothetical protein